MPALLLRIIILVTAFSPRCVDCLVWNGCHQLNSSTSRCFYLDDSLQLSWPEARRFCHQRDSTLATITDPDSQDIFQRFLDNSTQVSGVDENFAVWIGAHNVPVNTSVKWHWTDGQQSTGPCGLSSKWSAPVANTSVDNGAAYNASTLDDCLSMCVRTELCTGVDWATSQPLGTCWLSLTKSLVGPRNDGTKENITRYDITRTSCDALSAVNNTLRSRWAASVGLFQGSVTVFENEWSEYKHFICQYNRSSCEDGFMVDSHCYKLHKNIVTWFTAVNSCLADNGLLATFSDNSLLALNASLLPADGQQAWIGLLKTAWVWEDAVGPCLPSYTWSMLLNTNVDGGMVVMATNVEDCKLTCASVEFCDGVDWAPYDYGGRPCFLVLNTAVGPRHEGTIPQVTHYDIRRTACAKGNADVLYNNFAEESWIQVDNSSSSSSSSSVDEWCVVVGEAAAGWQIKPCNSLQRFVCASFTANTMDTASSSVTTQTSTVATASKLPVGGNTAETRAAVIGGVLGGVCFLLIVIIVVIFLCVFLRTKASTKKQSLGSETRRDNVTNNVIYSVYNDIYSQNTDGEEYCEIPDQRTSVDHTSDDEDVTAAAAESNGIPSLHPEAETSTDEPGYYQPLYERPVVEPAASPEAQYITLYDELESQPDCYNSRL